MGFLKYAKAQVQWPDFNREKWGNVRTAASQKASLNENLVVQAEEILKKPFNPENFLLTHATIVASVDTETVPNVKLGSVLADGQRIHRPYGDFRVTKETEDLFNNNNDSFERQLLLKAFPTFVGGHNFCFAGDTPILMGDGTYKNISQIEVGDEVLTHEGRVRKVTHLFERDFEGSVQELRFGKHKTPVQVTGNHPFLGVETTAERFPKNSRYRRDQIAKALRGEKHTLPGFEAKKAWVNAEDLTRFQYVLSPRLKTGQTHSVSEAFLLGYYAAEGCLLRNKRDGFVLSFGSHEQDLVNHAKLLCGQVFPNLTCSVYPKKNSTIHVVVFGKEAYEWAKEMCPGKPHEKRLSQKVFSWDKESLLALFTGWISGDGDYHVGTNRLRGHTTSFDLASQMKRVADLCGVETCQTKTLKKIGCVESQVTLEIRGEPITFDVIPRHHLWTLTVSKDTVAPIFNCSKRWEQTSPPMTTKRSDFCWWEDHRAYKVSQKREVSFQGKVYNFEVEEDHSYVIMPGIAVHNCEHVQIEEQSKGRILDAVARDIGRSVYIDILIATDRQHEELIRSIESGRMSTLSMGCLTQFTLCSKCGHLAKDEPELCHHIRYQKGSTYYDHNGVMRRIGELCGHHSYDDTGGVQFIEASWVETPAFVGAVLRNTIEPTQVSPEITKQAEEILSQPPKEWISNPHESVQKVAFFDDKEEKEDKGDGKEDKEDKKEKKPEKAPLKELEQDVYDHTIDSVRKRIKQDLEKEKSNTHFNKPIKTNNNLSKEGSTQMGRFLSASNKREAVGVLYRLLKAGEMEPISKRSLLASIRVGSIDQFSSSDEFQMACRDALGRDPTASELDELMFIGTLLSYRKREKNHV
jgi:hypothetical protein